MPIQVVDLGKLLAIDNKVTPPPVFGTRADLGTVVLKSTRSESYIQNSFWVESSLEYDPGNLKPGDFITSGEGVSRRILAGKLSEFPVLWGQWVANPYVQASAVSHIIKHKPAAFSLVQSATARMLLQDAFDAWMSVARVMLKQAYVTELDKRTNKRINGTQVLAMPIRIAQFLGNWNPPVARPVYEKGISNPEMFKLPVVVK